MRSALSFPDDFDGIMAGSPAVDMNHLLGWSGLNSRAVGAPNGNETAKFISDELWGVVSETILEQCDLLDGVKDGIITEPDDCFFDPSVLLCKDTDGSDGGNGTAGQCLTVEQLTAVNKIYSPIVDASGVELYPRFDPLAENTTLREITFNGSTMMYTFVSGLLSYLLFLNLRTHHDVHLLGMVAKCDIQRYQLQL